MDDKKRFRKAMLRTVKEECSTKLSGVPLYLLSGAQGARGQDSDAEDESPRRRSSAVSRANQGIYDNVIT